VAGSARPALRGRAHRQRAGAHARGRGGDPAYRSAGRSALERARRARAGTPAPRSAGHTASAAALAGAVALRKVRGTAGPCYVATSLLLLRLPVGALTAVIGIMFLSGRLALLDIVGSPGRASGEGAGPPPRKPPPPPPRPAPWRAGWPGRWQPGRRRSREQAERRPPPGQPPLSCSGRSGRQTADPAFQSAQFRFQPLRPLSGATVLSPVFWTTTTSPTIELV
jgi:hypothetical protein